MTSASRSSTTIFDAACEYARHGDPIFPVWWIEEGRCACGVSDCESPGKHPIPQHGLEDATTDEAMLRRWWWARHPNANIAMRTGATRTVLDVDPAKGGRDSLAQLAAKYGPLPTTAKVLTGGGGEHYHFAPVPGLRNSASKLGLGLDIRGEGGYVLMPPSSHISGGTYLDDVLAPMYETPFAPMPPWLIALATAQTANNGDTPHRTSDEWAEKLTGATLGQRHAVACEVAGHFLGLLGPTREVEVTEILLGYAARCDPPFSEREVRKIVRDLVRRDRQKPSFAPAGSAVLDTVWPTPQPVPTALPSVPAFDVAGLLPAALTPWAADVAERAQCPPDYVAIGVMVAVASVVGRQLTIRPKRHDDWTVVPNLWGLVVGPPGVMKTAAMHEALRGLRALIGDSRESHARALDEHSFRVEEAKAKQDAVRKQLKDAAAKGAPTETLREAFQATQEPEAPVERRYLVNDSTIEKLGELLNQNRNGLLLFRDELAGLLRSMEREGHENDRAFYCEAWNGTGSYTYDRIGRGTLHIAACCLSVLGAIQPMPLEAYLQEAFDAGHDDGLIQRFQLLVYPDVSTSWTNVDRWPDSTGRQRVVDLFRALDRLDHQAVGAHLDGLDALPFLQFSPEAQCIFDDWRGELEHRLRRADEHPAFLSHLAKYRSLVPTLALVLHIVDCVDRGAGGPVSVTACERSIAWAAYLEPHGRRVYEPITAPGRLATATLASKLERGELGEAFTARDVSRKGWTALGDREAIGTAVDQLEELGWLRREHVKPADGGRPTVAYHVNPAVVGRKS